MLLLSVVGKLMCVQEASKKATTQQSIPALNVSLGQGPPIAREVSSHGMVTGMVWFG